MLQSIFGRLALILAAAAVMPAWAATPGGTNVVTYHYDTLRTGWDAAETSLTPANVGTDEFGFLAQVALDEQVDAQPLYVSNQKITGAAHDVIYVATENNTIYAIDAADGSVLRKHNYGAGVPIADLFEQCSNNSDYVGISSTPVIDLASKTMYAITYTLENNDPTYYLHAVDLGTLADKIAPMKIAGSGTLSNGKTFNFRGYDNRQRTALLETNGNIYAGFSSWCDLGANVSRGWVMGWNAATLQPLADARLANQRPRSASRFYLTSVWMSGYGIASDGSSLFFTTGNSDPGGKSYNDVTNLDESVIKLSPDLSTVQDYFTPQGGQYGWSNLDKEDGDLSGGGVLVLPDQPGAVPHMAVVAGKVGPMYLLNRDHLGGLGPTKVTLGGFTNYECWCGQSYYQGADGIGRVVASTGAVSVVWKVETSPKPKLVPESYSPNMMDMQDPGFFTTVSSNGTTANTQIIWAMERPSDPNTNYVTLHAFDPSNGSVQLFAGVAGTWPFAADANANLVPIVANGHVFVASYKNISGFGLYGDKAKRLAFRAPPPPLPRDLPAGVKHELRGTVTSIDGSILHLKLRDGRALTVDMAAAQASFRVAQPAIGHAATVRGDYKNDVFVASSILHQKDSLLTWPADR